MPELGLIAKHRLLLNLLCTRRSRFPLALCGHLCRLLLLILALLQLLNLALRLLFQLRILLPRQFLTVLLVDERLLRGLALGRFLPLATGSEAERGVILWLLLLLLLATTVLGSARWATFCAAHVASREGLLRRWLVVERLVHRRRTRWIMACVVPVGQRLLLCWRTRGAAALRLRLGLLSRHAFHVHPILVHHRFLALPARRLMDWELGTQCTVVKPHGG
mmetsp:Transcript_13813/g.24140  ORF Transcript_13813/g.24140 Transcript_13813/m.24140 type:complete len:221 (+) Transcript_13813:1489-2151(+)